MNKNWNQDGWNRIATVAYYRAIRHLTPGEQRIIEAARPEIQGGRVLDLGVGAGRTIDSFVNSAAAYIAVDYAPAMVAAARENYPGVDIREGDARHLALPSGEFDFVLFSFNGIDYIHPDERNSVLTEAYRLLRPGGLFAFSTHNKNSLPEDGIALHLRPPAITLNPARYAVRVARYFRDAIRNRRNRRQFQPHAVWRDEIAFVVDGVHLSSILTSYIKPQAQVDALRAAGFDAPLLLIDDDGSDATTASGAPWLYFLVRKPATEPR